jgi:hypothetical protein
MLLLETMVISPVTGVARAQFAAGRADEAARTGQDRVEHAGQLEARRQVRHRLEQRLLLIGTAPLGGDEACPPDGDARVRRRGRQDLEVLVAERVRLLALDDEHAQHLIAVEQRHVDLGARAEGRHVFRRLGHARRVVQPPVDDGVVRHAGTGRHAQARLRARPAAAGAQHALAGLRVQQEQAEHVVAEFAVVQPLDNAAAHLVLVQRAGQRGAEPQQGGLPPVRPMGCSRCMPRRFVRHGEPRCRSSVGLVPAVWPAP